MNPKLKAYLIALGLSPTADETAAQSFLAALSADKRAEADKLAKDDSQNVNVTINMPEPTKAAALSSPAAAEDLSKAEESRVAALTSLGQVLKVDESVIALAIAEDDDQPKARKRYLAALAKKCPPVGGIGNVTVGPDQKIAALSAALPDSIALRAGTLIEKPHELAGKYRHLTLLDMYRHWLVALGVPADQVMFMPRTALVDNLGPRAAIRTFGVAALAQGTGSFDAVLLDAANKTARQAYQLAPATWSIWARRATAPDFKNINRIQISDVASLVSRNEGGEIKYFTLTDSKESYTLVEYVNGVRLTRKAMVNDDLDMFGRIPASQVRAAKQLEDDVAYAIITANANLSDSGALFNATAVTSTGGHANLHATTALVGAPSVTTLGNGRKAMRLQKGPKGQQLNLLPRFLIVPAALETVADQYTSASYVAAVQTNINPFASNGRTPLVPVVEPRLDASSATAWYLAADSAQIDTVEVCFLDSEPEPVLKQESDFDTDDMKFAVRHTVAAKAIDFRGLIKNNGA